MYTFVNSENLSNKLTYHVTSIVCVSLLISFPLEESKIWTCFVSTESTTTTVSGDIATKSLVRYSALSPIGMIIQMVYFVLNRVQKTMVRYYF